MFSYFFSSSAKPKDPPSSSSSSEEAPELESPPPKPTGWKGWGTDYVPYYGRYWNEKGTITKVNEACESVTKAVKDPENFFEGATKGILKGLTSGSGAEEGSSSLYGRITEIVKGGASALSAVALGELLNNAEVYDLDEKDKDLKEEASKELKKARKEGKNLKDTALSVWGKLNKYHIIFGGVNVNVKTSSSKKARSLRANFDKSERNDGVSPIHSLVRSQQKFRELRIKHDLPSPPKKKETISSASSSESHETTTEELENLKRLEEKTNKMIKRFSRKTVEYTTMYTLHTVFNHQVDPTTYNKILEEGGDIEEKYLERFGAGTLRRLFYKVAYRVVRWLIRPIIAETIKGVVTNLRSFLQNDLELLKFTENKIGDMSNYYGRIEKARRDYLNGDRTDEAGIFEKYLEESIRVYGSEFSEEDLLKSFGEYIVQNFVPRPKFTIRGFRIPLISSLLEWIVHSIRKSIVRRVLVKTGIVEKILTQGTESIHYAQLGLKRLLEQKLTQIVEMIDRSRSRLVKPLAEEGGLERSSSTQKLDLEAKKAKIISRQLHLAIQQHSQKLLRFIDIESCNGDERKMRQLDNRVSGLVTEVLNAICDVIKWEPFSLEKVLEDASTEVMETSLLALFEDKDEQIENQLQTIFEVLEKSYAHVPEENRAEAERRYREECSLVDENLNTLQEQLSRSGVEAALESHLKNVSGERHKAIKSYVKQEKEQLMSFAEELEEKGKALTLLANTPYKYDPDKKFTTSLKAELSQTVALMEEQLQHISMQLRSKELEGCYGDVRGDIHNIYASVIHASQLFYERMEEVAERIDRIREYEEELISTQKYGEASEDLSLEGTAEEVAEKLDALKKHLPKSLASKSTSIDQVKSLWLRREETAQQLEVFKHYTTLKVKEATLERKMKVFEETESKLKELSILLREEKDLTRNRRFPTQIAVDKEHKRIKEAMSRIYSEIMTHKDGDIQSHLRPTLDSKDSSELYKVFYNSWISSRSTAFKKLGEIRHFRQQELARIKIELSEISSKIESGTTQEGLEQTLRNLTEEMKDQLEQIDTALKQNVHEKKRDIKKELSEISKTTSQVIGEEAEIPSLLRHASDLFGVKGCISIGELKLYNTLAPQLVARIAPEITRGTRTMIDAMGKPFHYKQLVLRLAFVDIAKRHKASKG